MADFRWSYLLNQRRYKNFETRSPRYNSSANEGRRKTLKETIARFSRVWTVPLFTLNMWGPLRVDNNNNKVMTLGPNFSNTRDSKGILVNLPVLLATVEWSYRYDMYLSLFSSFSLE